MAIFPTKWRADEQLVGGWAPARYIYIFFVYMYIHILTIEYWTTKQDQIIQRFAVFSWGIPARRSWDSTAGLMCIGAIGGLSWLGREVWMGIYNPGLPYMDIDWFLLVPSYMTLWQLHIFAHAAMQRQRRHIISSFQQTCRRLYQFGGHLRNKILLII